MGIAEGCFDATMPYLLERKQFGTSIADFQGMRFQYAQVASEIQAAKLLVPITSLTQLIVSGT